MEAIGMGKPGERVPGYDYVVLQTLELVRSVHPAVRVNDCETAAAGN